MKSKKKNAEVVVTQVELEIPIAAPTPKVWAALTKEIDLWWRKDFYASERTKRFVLEPKLGGRMYEDAGEGAGVTWYTVMGIDPQRSLYLVGHLTSSFGGPATSILELVLEESGKTTVLKLTDSTLGPPSDCSSKESGWKMLFEEGLKAHVEGKKLTAEVGK